MFRYFKDYLSFSRSEKNALIILGLVLILVTLLNIFLPFLITPERKLTFQQLSDINRMQAILNDTSGNYNHRSLKVNYSTEGNESVSATDNMILFVFDPNTINEEDLREMKMPEKVIINMIKFRQKGGKFYKPEDIRKIYGMTENLYDKLEPFIRIESNRKTYKSNNNQVHYTQTDIYQVELNTASEADLDKLPSIGASFAKRIIKYRQLLGGYYQKEQLLEVYGLDSSIFSKIEKSVTIDPNRIKKITINLADIQLLGRHPYIGFKTATLIIDRRNKKGPYKNLQEVKEVTGNELYSKLFPYLKLWD